MAVVTIQSPTGESIQIEAPEGATDAQIFAFAQSQGLFNKQPQAVNSDVPTPENLAMDKQNKVERVARLRNADG